MPGLHNRANKANLGSKKVNIIVMSIDGGISPFPLLSPLDFVYMNLFLMSFGLMLN